MQQITLEKPGRFTARDVAEPGKVVGEHALVRVRRVGVCGTDLHAFAGRQPFFNYPRVLGHELGVEVVEAPANERGIVAGDRCAVEPYLNCGRCIACRRGRPNCCERLAVLGVHVDGGMRPLITVPVAKLHKSQTLSLDQLALVETLAIGSHAVARAAPQRGETALVVGAGPIGLGVIQALQAIGISPVVADVDDARLAFCRRTLGVTRTIDAGDADIVEHVRAACGGELPLIVFDATGHPESMTRAFDLTAASGRIVFVGLFPGAISFDDPHFHRRELTLLASRNATPGTFTRLIAQMEAGEIDTSPWITHRLDLADVPARFADLPVSPGLIKAMIEVG